MKEAIQRNEIYYMDLDFAERYTLDYARSLADKFCVGISANGIGIVPIIGALGHGFWDLENMDYISIENSISVMVANEGVKEIVLCIDSPGGAVAGLFSLCEAIEALSIKKPIHAFINGMACSAAYAIATACNDITIEPDASTGCCGAIGRAMKMDEEYMRKQLGLIQRVFRSKNAPKKCVSPIDDKDAQKSYQDEIDSLGAKYIDYVASRRALEPKEAEESFGKGSIINAEYALENNMVDRIATWNEFSEELSKSLASSLSSEEESEGADMKDIEKMSAEEMGVLFDALCSAKPELLSPLRETAAKEERKRIMELMALRNGSAAYNQLVDEAIASGAGEKETKLALFDFIQSNPTAMNAPVAQSTNAALEAFAEADQTVNPVKAGMGEDEKKLASVMAEVNNKNKEAR